MTNQSNSSITTPALKSKNKNRSKNKKNGHNNQLVAIGDASSNLQNKQISAAGNNESSSEAFIEEYIVILSNIQANQLEDSDIEFLLNSFIEQNSNLNSIDSVQVFKDCVYVVFLNNSGAAYDAVKYFNNYMFKSHQIQAHLVDNDDLFLDLNSIFNSNNDQNSKEEATKVNFSEIDCEILVTNRQVK